VCGIENQINRPSPPALKTLDGANAVRIEVWNRDAVELCATNEVTRRPN